MSHDQDYEPVSDWLTFTLFTAGTMVLCFAVAGVVSLIRSMFAA